MDSDRCRLLASECSWKERLLLAVDLPAPYFDEKLSGWRGLRANMMQSRYSEVVMLQCRTDARVGWVIVLRDADACGDTGTILPTEEIGKYRLLTVQGQY